MISAIIVRPVPLFAGTGILKLRRRASCVALFTIELVNANQNDRIERCAWAQSEPNIKYHDEEWGVPQHDDRVLFEFLILEGAQAGLSWSTILNKRKHYRRAFDGFDPARIARYSEAKLNRLLIDPGIVRNRAKVAAAVQNAKAFLAVQKEFNTFDAYVWQFVGWRPIQNAWQSTETVPAQTSESQTMSKDLLKRGFRFVGPTICYAFMQAVGLVNDHLVTCYRYQQVQSMAKK